jgi:hypothetical protein
LDEELGPVAEKHPERGIRAKKLVPEADRALVLKAGRCL